MNISDLINKNNCPLCNVKITHSKLFSFCPCKKYRCGLKDFEWSYLSNDNITICVRNYYFASPFIELFNESLDLSTLIHLSEPIKYLNYDISNISSPIHLLSKLEKISILS